MNVLNNTTHDRSSFLDLDTLVSHPIQYPIYHIFRADIVPGISDKALSLLAPLVAFWALSLFFHLLDSNIFKWGAKYRLHPSEEIQRKNFASRRQVVTAAISQQVVQTFFGVLWLDDSESDAFRNHVDEMRQLEKWIVQLAAAALGQETSNAFLSAIGKQAISWLYWWGIPITQYLLAIFIVDAWQYFAHRALHSNQTLYKYIHSVHHRLYVPYSYGAMYNHPVEGLLLDTFGAALAQALTFMTMRQATLLFVLTTIKGVDDHAGYDFPWDPLQLLFGSDADYHDIHHQAIGIKSNFSQAFFTHWDVLLGTRVTRSEIDDRRRKSWVKAAKAR